MHYFANNSKLFLKNFYMKSKRSIEKPKNEGPAAYVLPGDEIRAGNQAELRTLQAQGVEISKATAPFTVAVGETRHGSAPAEPRPSPSPTPAPKTEDRTFPAGSYIVRMDQPYSRIADALLDYQYWAPNDPQQDIYDDTAGPWANSRTSKSCASSIRRCCRRDGTRHGRRAFAGRVITGAPVPSL